MHHTRRVLITGASSGIGLATAQLFAEHGWQVIACSRNAADIPPHPTIRVMTMDISAAASVEACFDILQKEGLHIDVLINNAGYGLRQSFTSMHEKDIADMFETNVFGTMRVTRAWLSSGKPHTQRTVITVGSFAGYMGMQSYSAYCATKHALEGWSESLAYDLASQAVTVKIVEPLNVVDTNFFQSDQFRAHEPVGKTVLPKLKAHDVAHTLVRAATDGKKQFRYIVARGLAMRAMRILHGVFPEIAMRLMHIRYRRLSADSGARIYTSEAGCEHNKP